MNLRQARHDDRDAVVAFTRDTWQERDGSDYIPDVFEQWIETDGERQRTTVAVDAGDPVGIVQTVHLTEHEAWQQGMRVHPDYRGEGVAIDLAHAGFDWARERGATVARNMVFSWNEGGLGLSRMAGYDPGPEFRWAHPDPDPDAELTGRVTNDLNAAWGFWQDAAARDTLDGLGLHYDETWALAAVSRDVLERARDAESLLVVDDDGTTGMTYRTRVSEREAEKGVETWAEYGAAAWTDADAAAALLAAVARDAAAVGADRIRVLIPETTRAVSDVAANRVDVSDDPDFVFRADLTRPYRDEHRR
ncbi:MAG: N-acetyltransferase family protein [Halobacteriota archaeon]